MCLEKDHWFPKISWKPIKCYKLLYHYENNKLVTPWKHSVIELNIPIRANKNLFSSLFTKVINGEGVHAYSKLSTSTFIQRFYNEHDMFVYEAIIPPFTFYWEGKSNDIAARKLIVTKEIENYEQNSIY